MNSRVFVSPIGTGFGDVLISLPVIQSLIDQGEEVYLVTRSFRQRDIAGRVTGLMGEISEDELSAELKATQARLINLRDHPLQTDHVWGSTEFEEFFGPTNMEKLIKEIAADFGVGSDFQDLKPLRFDTNQSAKDAIAFVPGTDAFYKHWPHEHWLSLLESLQAEGKRVVLAGKPDESPAVKRLVNEGMEFIETKAPGDAVDLISSCSAVVAVDTGLMHVAVQQHIPTYTFIHPRNFHARSAPHCHNFNARDCSVNCKRDFTPKTGFAEPTALGVDLKFDHVECELSLNENCMASITPASVFARMKETKSI